MKPSKLLPWLPNYLKAFGLARGLATFARVMRLAQANSERPLPLRVPGLARPVWLRAALHDISIFQQIFVKGEYDLRHAPHFAQLEAAYRNLLAHGQRPLIIDCGSHIGLSVLWWRQLFPEAWIVAVEPSRTNLDVLHRNLEGLEAITVLHGGVWNRSTALHIQNPDMGAAAFRLGVEASGGEEIHAYTMNEIMQQAGAEFCLLAKIDIEGGEAELFSSDVDWLDRTYALAVELHDWLCPWVGTSRAMFRALSSRDFDYIMRGENMLCFQRAPSALLRPAQMAAGSSLI